MKALTFRKLSKTYKNGVQALKGIDLEVEEGDFFALLGPNGAGKTTAIGIVTSLVNKSGGEVEIFGHDLDRELAVAKACIGVVPQEINLNMFERSDYTLINQAGYYGVPPKVARERAEKYLKALHLWDKRAGIARTLSGGMKRRLMIARALVHEPRNVVLDEPGNGLDVMTTRALREFLLRLRGDGRCVLFSSHLMHEVAQLCDRIVVIAHGRVVASGTPEELRAATGCASLEDAFVAAIGSEEGLYA